MRYWHIRLSSQGRMTLFPNEASRRRAARTIARIGGPRLVQFSIVDDHVHVEVVCEEAELAVLRSSLSRALAALAADALAPSYVVEVKTRTHLRRNVDYFLTQTGHHRLDDHPAIDAGCCFQDLVGARLLPGFDPGALKRALPRLDRAELLGIVGLPGTALVPTEGDGLRRAGAARIVDACAAALGVPLPVTGRWGGMVARRAAVQLSELGGVARSEVREVLRISGRAVRWLASRPGDPRVLRAARLRLSLEDAVAEQQRRRRRAG